MKDDFIQGVNLGGWLLLEKWMTPSLFAGTDAVDEYTFMQTPGALEKVETHRRNFITEEDFAWLADNKINAVRIPVGFWTLEEELPFHSAVSYLDWAFDMAEKYGLKVLLDLHGLPGSQNGRDHSGRVGRSDWYRFAVNRENSVQSVANLARRYKDHASLWGIQIINEPRFGIFNLRLRRYYKRAYRALTSILPANVSVVISDGFTPRLMSGSLRPTTHPVILDVHLYHMATPLANLMPIKWFLDKTKRRQKMLARLSRQQPIIIGEWSGVISHKTMRKIPKNQHKKLFVDYVKLQQQAFRKTAGWFYWSYKTEKPGQWSFRSQVEAGNINLQ